MGGENGGRPAAETRDGRDTSSEANETTEGNSNGADSTERKEPAEETLITDRSGANESTDGMDTSGVTESTDGRSGVTESKEKSAKLITEGKEAKSIDGTKEATGAREAASHGGGESFT